MMSDPFVEFSAISKTEGSRRLSAVSRAIRWRSTSKAEDEAVCLATLQVKLDVSVVQNTNPNRRIMQLWSMYEEYPLSIFFAGYQKLTDDGLLRVSWGRTRLWVTTIRLINHGSPPKLHLKT